MRKYTIKICCKLNGFYAPGHTEQFGFKTGDTMMKVKQELFDLLLEEFDRSSSYAISRTLFLFCQDNEGFVLPDKVQKKFVEGIRNEEVRAFGLLYGRKARNTDGVGNLSTASSNNMARKAEFEKLVLKLSLSTEKTYSDQMVELLNAPVKGGLSYDDILEMFVVAGNPID